MDFGLAGKKAIVCTVNTDLGLACAQALAREGAEVFVTANEVLELESALDQIGVDVAGRV